MKKQNEISLTYLNGSDLQDREAEVLKNASNKLGVVPIKILSRSSWWTSKQIGAFNYLVEFEGKKAVLKIQGIKPETSEIYMIQSFKKTNKSKIIRPPHLYSYLSWSDEERYEALILEYVNGKRIISTPTNKLEIDRFYELFDDYIKNCLNYPWIDKPEQTISQKVENNFLNWKKTSLKIYPNHPLREKEDINLIDKAVEILIKEYKGVEPKFQHPHLTERDLKQEEDQVIVGSNFYWGWRAPLYDAVFGFHWFKYHLADVPDIKPEKIDEQINLWISRIEKLPNVQRNNRLYKLAMLERYAAGLNLDALSINPKIPIARYLVEYTRSELQRLISELH